MRRLSLAVVVVLLAGVAATVRAPDAAALGPAPFNDLRSNGTSSTFWSNFRGLLRGSGSTATSYGTLVGSESTATRNGLNTNLYRARVGARYLPKLGLVASRLTMVGAGISAAYIGWRVYQHFSDSTTTQVDLWIDSNSLGADALLNPLAVFGTYTDRLRWYGADWVRGNPSECTSVIGVTDCFLLDLVPGLYFAGDCCEFVDKIGNAVGNDPTALPGSAARTRWGEFGQCNIGGTTSPCYGPWASYPGNSDVSWGYQNGYMAAKTMINLAGRDIGGYTIRRTLRSAQWGASGCLNNGPCDAWTIAVPDWALGADLSVNGSGTLTSPNQTTDYTVPSNAGATSADMTAALDAFDSPCGRALINHLLEPTLYAWVSGCIEAAPDSEPEADVMTLPKPQLNETYSAYVTRLQSLGWVGAATVLQLDVDDATVGPEAVSRISVTGQPGVWTTRQWPVTWPQIELDTPLTIRHNSASAPPVEEPETQPGAGGGVLDPGANCDPWLEADPDFSPLTGVDYGDKFPFGLFAWVAGVLDDLSVPMDAPSWTFNLTVPATAVSPEYVLPPFEIDLELADDYMATIREVVSWVLWVGAIWYFAMGLLGMRAPGNPAEAVDEA